MARLLWLPAHLDYAGLGAAYDTFGNFNSEINGRPNGLPGGVDDPHFEGFLRLEYGLWHRQPATELKPVTANLDAAVRGLLQQFPQMLTPANDLSLRTHEILENTLQFELTGESDEGSHTNLATAFANVQGTEAALGAIAPLLALHDRGLLEEVSAGLHGLGRLVGTYERRNGTWTPLEDLTRPQRERLDGAVSSLLEQLAPIPDLLELPVQPDRRREDEGANAARPSRPAQERRRHAERGRERPRRERGGCGEARHLAPALSQGRHARRRRRRRRDRRRGRARTAAASPPGPSRASGTTEPVDPDGSLSAPAVRLQARRLPRPEPGCRPQPSRRGTPPSPPSTSIAAYASPS